LPDVLSLSLKNKITEQLPIPEGKLKRKAIWTKEKT
jgi:hypothetical protein